MQRRVELQLRVEAVEPVRLRADRHVVPGGELLDQRPGSPGVERPQVGDVACSFFAASETSGQVLSLSGSTPALASASLFSHMTMDDELKGKDNISPFTVE